MRKDLRPQHFEVGDLVLVINADYNPDLIGYAGSIARPPTHVSGYDRYGRQKEGIYLVVDLPDKVNRHGTTLWYKKPEYLIKILPDHDVQMDTREVLPGETGIQVS